MPHYSSFPFTNKRVVKHKERERARITCYNMLILHTFAENMLPIALSPLYYSMISKDIF